ncbi:winged helix-turn-helix transcriptional regulator, partial [Streptomyces chartreusis]
AVREDDSFDVLQRPGPLRHPPEELVPVGGHATVNHRQRVSVLEDVPVDMAITETVHTDRNLFGFTFGSHEWDRTPPTSSLEADNVRGMPERRNLAYDNCPAARALDVIGDRWALIIVREIFKGAHRFEELRRRLPISENTLARRLHELTRDGVLSKHAYATRPLRHEYVPTEAGAALADVLDALGQWGLEWTEPDPSGPPPPELPPWALDGPAPQGNTAPETPKAPPLT